MKLASFDVEILIEGGLDFYFKKEGLQYATVRADLLGKKVVGSIVNHLSDQLNEAEDSDKTVTLKNLLKAYYQNQIRLDEQESYVDKQAAEHDADRKNRIPDEIKEINREIDEASLKKAGHEEKYAQYESAKDKLIPQTSALSNELMIDEATRASTLSQIEEKQRALNTLLCTLQDTPRQIVVPNENPTFPPPPHLKEQQRVAGSMPPPPHQSRSQQVVVEAPPPVYRINPRVAELQVEIERLRLSITGLQSNINAVQIDIDAKMPALKELQRQASEYSRLMGDEGRAIESLNQLEVRLSQKKGALNVELNTTIPRNERKRATQKAGRDERALNREACAPEIKAGRYDEDVIRTTLSSLTQSEFDSERSDKYSELSCMKSRLNTSIDRALYNCFLKKIDTFIPSLKMTQPEKDALRLIQSTLQKYFESEKEVAREKGALQVLTTGLSDEKRFLIRDEGQLEKLQKKNPTLLSDIEKNKTDTQSREGVVGENQQQKKKWKIASIVMGSIALVSLIPVVLYAASVIALSALALGIISAVPSLFGLGTLVGLFRVRKHNNCINRENVAISKNTDNLRYLNRSLAHDNSEMDTLSKDTIPRRKADIGVREKEVEGQRNTLTDAERRRGDFQQKAEQISPSRLDAYSLASAPPPPVLDDKPPAYSPNA
jgi:hypothetical protein